MSKKYTKQPNTFFFTFFQYATQVPKPGRLERRSGVATSRKGIP